jgi:altronate dehydratase large subunit
MGGQGLPEHEPAVPSVATGFVSPIFYTTGNPRTYTKASHEMDFNAGEIITSGEKLDVVGSRLLERVLETASGTVTKAETLDYQDPVEIYLKGPCL